MLLVPIRKCWRSGTRLLQTRPTVAIGGSDAHANVYQLGILRRRFLPYEYCFRSVNTHILTTEPFTGDVQHDRPLVYEALGAGRAWIGYDRVHPTRGFKFVGRTEQGEAAMGDSHPAELSITFEVKIPASAHLRLMRAGFGVVAETQGSRLSYTTSDPGAYRVEAGNAGGSRPSAGGVLQPYLRGVKPMAVVCRRRPEHSRRLRVLNYRSGRSNEFELWGRPAVRPPAWTAALRLALQRASVSRSAQADRTAVGSPALNSIRVHFNLGAASRCVMARQGR